MEAVLIERWLRGLESIAVIDVASVSLVRERVRTMGAELNLGETATGRLVNVASELAHNQLAHGEGGRVACRPVERAGDRGLEVIAADRGDGIIDPRGALRGREPNGKSLGTGLAAVCELADEVDFDVRLGEGTCVFARKFSQDLGPRRCVGVFGRPIDGERTSGDDAKFVRQGDELLVALSDGLGHGIEARAASSRAVETLDGPNLANVMERAKTALVGTRGAVMTLAHIDTNAVELALVGNANAYVCGRRTTRRHTGSASILGSRGPTRTNIAHDTLTTGEVIAMFSDGLSSHVSLEQEDTLPHMHPIVIAQTLMERFGSLRDDAMVIVIR